MSESVRKSIKKIAFEEPKGVHIKAFVIYLLILGVISYLGEYFLFNNGLIMLFSFIISLPLYLNLIKICLDSSRDVLVGVGDLFKFKKYSFKFSLYYGFIILLVYLLDLIMGFIPMGSIISFVIFLCVFPVIVISPFVFLDDTDILFLDFIRFSFKLVSKKTILFYGLLFSFALWFVLGLLSLGVLYIWLIPYILISMAYLYLYLNKEKDFKKEKILSDKVIVVLAILFIVFLNILSFKLYPNDLSDFKKDMEIVNK